MSDEHGTELRAEQRRRNPEPEKGSGGWGKGLATVLLGVVVVGGGLGAAGWWFYNQGQPTQSEGDLPIIMPDPGPVKVRPDNPGGMEVPHRDTTIYQELDESEKDNTVSIQELPDMPKAPDPAEIGPAPGDATDQPAGTEPADGATANATDQTAPAGKGGDTAAKTVEKGADMTAPDVKKPLQTDTTDQKTAAAPETVASPTQGSAKSADKPAPAAKTSSGGAYRIQLASLRSDTGAAKEWKRLSSQNKDLLGNLQMHVEKADLGDKGVFYRLQAAGLADESAARALCADLKKRNVGCLIVRP
jgi:hypothetical protein